MMRRLLLAGALLALAAGSAFAQEAAPTPPAQKWSFDGIFGTYDRASLQRGFLIYKDVCSACHSMNLLSYRNLEEIGLSAAQVKAVAASVQVPDARCQRPADDAAGAAVRPVQGAVSQ